MNDITLSGSREVKCKRCGKPVVLDQVAIMAGVPLFIEATVCDACAASMERESKLAKLKARYEELVPELYRPDPRASLPADGVQHDGWRRGVVVHGEHDQLCLHNCARLVRRALLDGKRVSTYWRDEVDSLLDARDSRDVVLDRLSNPHVLILDGLADVVLPSLKLSTLIGSVLVKRSRLGRTTVVVSPWDWTPPVTHRRIDAQSFDFRARVESLAGSLRHFAQCAA
jgi:hypothetical protein